MLTPGTSFGPYTIVESIGVGGMGEIYRATESRLKRSVAIKVLPESLAGDAGRLARFRREAEMLAALNHANIAQIFGLEQFSGGTALVLELVEGPTLAERIAAGPIPADEALGIALQIAAALEAAHAQGIVHRDLKPANIKVRPDGTVKVLDFGIAKALDMRQAAGAQAETPSNPAMTEVGMLLGTAAYYVAPEQARGKSVDARADIWAFGCVLYEMLTAQSAFGGEDTTDTLARVLERPTDFSRLSRQTPPAVRRTLELCLEKDPRKRIADIRDVKLALEGRFETRSADLYGQAPAASAWRRVSTHVSALVAGAVLVALAAFTLRPEPEPKPVRRFLIPLPAGQTLGGAGSFNNVLDLAPDGSSLVYATAAGLRLRDFATLDDRAIPGTDQTSSGPVFSPDGLSIAFVSGNTAIRRVAVSGGPTVLVSDVNTGVRSLRWTPDGTLLFSEVGVSRVPTTGGARESLVEGDGAGMKGPDLLPDNDTLLFTRLATATDAGQIYAQSLATGERWLVLDGAGDARYVPTGHLVYGVGNTLFGIAFDAETKRTRGAAVPLVQGVQRSTIGGTSPQYALANDGTLAYVRSGGTLFERTLVWVDRDGRETPIAAPARNYVYLALSPDETRVALDIRDRENDTWVFDLGRENPQRLTFDPGNNRGAVFSQDGRRIAFTRQLGDTEEIYWQAADGSGSAEPLTQGSGRPMHPVDLTRDGATLLFTTADLPRDIFMIPVAGPAGAGTPLIDGPASEGSPTVSPDGRWLAYSSNESGAYEIYVRPFPDVEAGRWQVSSTGGIHPQWSRDGTELYYLEAVESIVTMLAARIEPGQTFRAGIPTVLFSGPYFYGAVAAGPDVYDVAADGRFLMIKQAEVPGGGQPDIIVVENWTEELKRLVPAE